MLEEEEFQLKDDDESDAEFLIKDRKMTQDGELQSRPQQEKSFAQSYSENIEEWENVPAFLRKKKANSNTRNEESSKYSVSKNESDETQINSDNSFLHNRVD